MPAIKQNSSYGGWGAISTMQFIDNNFSKIEEKGKLFSLIFLGSLLLHFFLPWWICALVAFLAAFWQAESSKQAFLVGGAAIGLLWGLATSFWHFASGGILSDKVAAMFQLPNGLALNAVLMIIAALVGGNAAMSGYLVRALFRKN
jgi:hypothetical protein